MIQIQIIFYYIIKIAIDLLKIDYGNKILNSIQKFYTGINSTNKSTQIITIRNEGISQIRRVIRKLPKRKSGENTQSPETHKDDEKRSEKVVFSQTGGRSLPGFSSAKSHGVP